MDLFRGRSKLPFYFHVPEVPSTGLTPDDVTGDWPVGFRDLPNEIILSILDELEDEEVFLFAFVSRDLHHLSLPLYLSRKGFSSHPDGQLSLFNYNAWDCIKALGVTLFKPKLRRVFYAIDCRRTAEELSAEFRMVRAVLGKLQAVHEVVISFQDVPRPEPGLSPILSPGYFGSKFDEVRERESIRVYGLTPGLCTELTELLDSLVLGGRCTSLSFSNCFLYSPSSAEIKAAISHYFGGARSVKNIITKKVRRLVSFLDSHRVVTRSGLESFKIHARMVFHPHLCRWTINLLNESTLTTLSIAHHHTMDNTAWAVVLSSISIPTLTSLTVDYSTISPQELLLFLNRHSGIRTLYIGRHIPSPQTGLNHKPLPSNCMLRQLIHLTATPTWVAFFITPKTSLPSLQNIKFLLHFPDTRHFIFSTLDETLEPTIERLSKMKQLHLALTFGSPLTDWMASVDPIRTPREPSATTSENRSPKPPPPPHSLITHLELYTRTYVVPRWVIAKIPRWLGSQSFHALRHLILVSPGLSAPVLASAPSLENGVCLPPSEKETLVRSIGESCPAVAVDFRELDDEEFPVLLTF